MLTYVLAAIAAISMIVGGIGIMNIMWVTVVERTQEIGIRRTVGSRRRDIFQQFVAEAVALSMLSGFLGVGGALVLTYVVGVAFGVGPAWRASRIETLNALRYE
ncbi:MAG: hypothetical protein RIS36_90 [Pseudomonadota bacterium]|jgi:putative ABC transport system permease protein